MSDNHVNRQPILLIPDSIKWLAGLTIAIHLLLEFGPLDLANGLYRTLTYIPLRFAHPDLMASDPAATVLSPVGYALLHGSWMHLLVNMGMLMAFGTPLIRQAGNPFFFLVYVFGALAGAASVSLLSPQSQVHVIGASASVSALLGALVAYALKPGLAGPVRQPGFFQSRERTLTFLAVWVAINILFGVFPGALFGIQGRIAWEAHLGGLLIGLLITLIHLANLRRRQGG